MAAGPAQCAGGRATSRAEELAGVGTWHLDLATGELTTNATARAMFGWAAEGPTPTLAQFLGCVHPQDAARVATAADLLVRSGVDYVLEHRAVLPSGRLAYLRSAATAHLDAGGRALCLHGTCLDVTDLQRVAAEAERSRARARAVLDTLQDGYLLASAGVLVEVNAALCRITGYSAEELEGAQTPYPFWDPAQRDHLLAVRARLAATGGGSAEVDAVRKDGVRIRLALSATVLPPDGDRPLWAVLVRDVTDERARSRQLESEAHTDQLTGLANSRTFRERLREAVLHAGHRPLSLAVLDLDRFKAVNDSHGHAVGDGVLAEAARRLARAVGGSGTLARIGGEEFAVLMPGLTAHEGHEVMRHALADLRATPFPVAGTVTASAGVAQLLEGMDDDALFRFADALLYEAKRRGRDQVR